MYRTVALALGCLWVLPAVVSRAAADPAAIAGVEARIGHGVAVGGGVGESAWRRSPITVTVLGDLAVRDDPWLSVVAGGVFETSRRATVGTVAGLRIRPHATGFRVGGGGVAIIRPTTAYGAYASLGNCVGTGVRLCTDIEGTVFWGGRDVPDQRIAAQVQLVFGLAVDAW